MSEFVHIFLSALFSSTQNLFLFMAMMMMISIAYIWNTLYATVLTGPYLILFFGTWIAASLARPLLQLTLISALVLHPWSAWRKLQLFLHTLAFLIWSKDKRWKTPPTDPATFFSDSSVVVDKKTIFFVRHGESTWNDTFNKGTRKTLAFARGFVPGLLKAFGMEWYFWVTGQSTESWFYDAPLSHKGLTQAESIQEYLLKSRANLEFMPLKEQQLVRTLLGEDYEEDDDATNNHNNKTIKSSKPPKGQGGVLRNKSQLVSSTLRRSISTMAVAFSDRLKKSSRHEEDKDSKSEATTTNGGEVPALESTDHGSSTVSVSSPATTTTKTSNVDSILLLPQLQEISFNPDALCITPAHTRPTTAFTDPRSIQSIYQTQVNVQHHTGNKKLFQSNGLHRLQSFCHAMFDETVIPASKTSVICGGHSLWFRSFFRTYLPYSVQHVSKKKKLTNGGVVAFTLQRTKTEPTTDACPEYHYLIDPSSIVVLHGGF